MYIIHICICTPGVDRNGYFKKPHTHIQYEIFIVFSYIFYLLTLTFWHLVKVSKYHNHQDKLQDNNIKHLYPKLHIHNIYNIYNITYYITSQIITYHHISSKIITYHHISSHIITYHRISSHIITYHHR